MNIVWDDAKNRKLIFERGISFEEAAELILQERYVDILKNPTKDNQFYFLVLIKNYIHVVPFLINDKEEIVLKTIFPS
ncbi:MAG: BrnT family toxin, partial [Candidatus Omnitrophica bacterium]|nr:BrnT family toxin [Candidatus Omnitrophota bacterium]